MNLSPQRTRFATRGALCALFVSIGLTSCAPSDPAAKVEGWRDLTADEVAKLAAERQADDPATPAPVTSVSGDFNGDGKTDRVVFLVSDANAQFTPYFIDGAGAAPQPLAHGDARSRLFRYSLAVLPPGIAYGLCTEEKSDPQACEAEKAFKSPGVVFFEVNNGGSVYLWDGKSFAERPMRKSIRGRS